MVITSLANGCTMCETKLHLSSVECRVTPSLRLLSGLLWPWMVVSVRVPSVIRADMRVIVIKD